MSVKLIPAVTRTVIDAPAKVVLELSVEEAARYHALLGRFLGGLDASLYEELSAQLPQAAQRRYLTADVIRPEQFVPRF